MKKILFILLLGVASCTSSEVKVRAVKCYYSESKQHYEPFDSFKVDVIAVDTMYKVGDVIDEDYDGFYKIIEK